MLLNKATTKQDSTKIQAYLTCERKYFFEHILGYRSIEPIHNLVFGSCAHEAKDVLLTEGYSSTSVSHAYDAFIKSYREVYGMETDMTFHPKSPGNVELWLNTYIKDYATDNFEVVATEIGFSMLLSESRILYGRIDAIIKMEDGKYYVLETKTGSKAYGYMEDSYQQKFQVLAYTNFLYSYYEPEQVGGVIIDQCYFHKSEVVNVRYPIHKKPEHMLAWLRETNRRFNALEEDFRLLQEVDNIESPVMVSFPKRRRTEGCVMFNRTCPYHWVCMARENPLKRANFLPEGYKIEFWDCTKQKVKSNIEI